MRSRTIAVALMVMALAGCKQVADQRPVHSFPNATMRWGDAYAWTDSLYAEVGRYSLFETQYQDVLGPVQFSTARLRRVNPGIRIGMYIHGHSVAEWELRSTSGPARDWADMALAHLAYTTEGDTARPFNKAYYLTVNDSATVRAMVGVLEKWVVASPNAQADSLSWMIDYMTSPATPYVYGEWARQQHGELDLDRDRVPHERDDNEQQALRDGYAYYIDLLRERMPWIKVRANGELPYRDHDLMKRLDGVFIEGGFRWGFGERYVTNALVGQPPYNFAEIVTHFRPGGYSVLEAQFYSPQAMAMAMMLDAPEHRIYAVVKPRDGTRTLAPDPLLSWNVGAPIEPAKVDGMTLIRTFERGTATLRLGPGVYPDPFGFEILDHDGRLITEVGQ